MFTSWLPGSIRSSVMRKDSDNIGISEWETPCILSKRDDGKTGMFEKTATAVYPPFHCSEGASIS